VRKHIVDLVRIALEPTAEADVGDGSEILLSRSWLRNWKLKQCRVSHLSDGVVSPTLAIMCRHGRLLPERPKKGCACMLAMCSARCSALGSATAYCSKISLGFLRSVCTSATIVVLSLLIMYACFL
jgi:hypothetical protein